MSPPHIWWTESLSLREEYQKSGGLVVTYFSYFHYFPNGGRFFLLGADLFWIERCGISQSVRQLPPTFG